MQIVARVLRPPEGGRKGVPSDAGVVALINKGENPGQRTAARETAEQLLREPAIQSVVLASLLAAEPVVEVYTR